MGMAFKILNVTVPHFAHMEKLFRVGRTANYVQNFMSGVGAGYRRSTVQAVRREVLGLLVKEERVKGLSGSMTPNKSQIAETEWSAPGKYKLFGQIDRTNEYTGVTERVDVSKYFSQMNTKDALIHDMFDQLEKTEYVVSYTYANFNLQQILHKKGDAW